MRAVLCSRPKDDLSTTTLTDLPVPEIGPGEIKVAMRAASLNPVDWKLCAGVAPWWDSPHIVGLDGAGVVEEISSCTIDLRVGDRVMWHGNLNRDGVFADHALTVAHVVSKVPENVSFEQAAALPCAGITAFQAIVRKLKLETDQTFVVQGASGGVGGFALQIAKILGARTIALVRPENERWVGELGADEVLDYADSELAVKVRELTKGEGADAFLEVVNPNDARKSLDLLRYNGQMAVVDKLPDLTLTPSYKYAASIHEIALGGAYAANDLRTQRDFAVMGEKLLKWVSEKKLNPLIEKKISLEDVPDYLVRLRNREFVGKAVINI